MFSLKANCDFFWFVQRTKWIQLCPLIHLSLTYQWYWTFDKISLKLDRLKKLAFPRHYIFPVVRITDVRRNEQFHAHENIFYKYIGFLINSKLQGHDSFSLILIPLNHKNMLALIFIRPQFCCFSTVLFLCFWLCNVNRTVTYLVADRNFAIVWNWKFKQTTSA